MNREPGVAPPRCDDGHTGASIGNFARLLGTLPLGFYTLSSVAFPAEGNDGERRRATPGQPSIGVYLLPMYPTPTRNLFPRENGRSSGSRLDGRERERDVWIWAEFAAVTDK